MLILIYGDDTYRSNERLLQMKKKYIADIDPSGMNVEIIEGNRLQVEACVTAMKSMPFMVERRLVIIKNIFGSKKGKEFYQELKKVCEDIQLNEETSNIVIFYEDSKSLGNNGLARFLKATKHVTHMEPLQGFAINKWIKQTVRTKGGRIDEEAVKELASLVGDNLWVMNQEIDKLIAYRTPEEKITKEDVCLLVHGVFDEDIFAVIDALGGQNKQHALNLLHEHIEGGMHELYILTMMIRQYRILIQVKDMLSVGKSKKEISLALGVHPFVIQKAISQSQAYSIGQLALIYRQLFQIERQLKGGAMSGNGDILFDVLIAKM